MRFISTSRRYKPSGVGLLSVHSSSCCMTASRPSFSKKGINARAATGSAHHQPQRALRPSPKSKARSWRSHTRLSTASDRRALEPNLLAILDLAQKSSVITTALAITRAMPTRLTLGSGNQPKMVTKA